MILRRQGDKCVWFASLLLGSWMLLQGVPSSRKIRREACWYDSTYERAQLVAVYDECIMSISTRPQVVMCE
jgi:hypothetical protein